MDTTLELRTLLAGIRLEATDAPVRLAAPETVTHHLRAGACIAVQAGRIWLTQTGDANDYVVDAGQRHVVARSGRVVIESLAPRSTLRVLRGAPPARPGFP